MKKVLNSSFRYLLYLRIALIIGLYWSVCSVSQAQIPSPKLASVISNGQYGNGPALFQPSDIFISGNYAYVISRLNNYLEIVDISNPIAPVQKGVIFHGNNGALLENPNSVFVSGNYAYVVGNSNALEIVDVSNPSAPIHAGALVNGDGGTNLSSPNSVFVLGNYAYISSQGNTTLEIVDISDQAAPIHAGNLNLAFFGPTSIFVSGQYAFLTSSYQNALAVVNISNPSAPFLTGFLSNGSNGALLTNPTSVYVSGDYAYVTSNGNSALEIINVANPSAPSHIGSLTDGTGGAKLAYPNQVYVSGVYAYVASINSRPMEIVNISNPALPVHAGSMTLSDVWSVGVSGGFAFVVGVNNGSLEVVDISNPFAPLVKASLVNETNGATLSFPRSVFVLGNYAYVASSGSGALEILDVTNPDSPLHKGSISDGIGGALLKSPSGVYVSGSYAFIASSNSNALEIVDISDPSSPVHAGSISNGTGGALLNQPYSVYISGRFAYLTSFGSNALEIVDISNPSTPVHAGSISDGSGGAMLNQPYSVYVSGNYAYVASYGSNALEIIDVSNPAAPVHAGSLANGAGGALLSVPISVFVSGTYAYVASKGSNALEIVNVTNPTHPVHAGSLADGNGGALLNYPTSVAVSGNYAYVVSYNSNALEIVDVSNPNTPTHSSNLVDGSGGALLFNARSAFVAGNFAYVAGYGNGALDVIDLSSAPIEPILTSPSSIGQTSFRVNWTGASSETTGYFLDISESITFSTFVPGYQNLSIGNVNFLLVDANVSPGTIYYCRVRAVNNFGLSLNSNVIRIQTVPDTPMAAAASFIGQNGFTATWNSVFGASNYYLDVAIDSNFLHLISAGNNRFVSSNSINVSNLTAGQTYYYRVRSADANGASPSSNFIAVPTIPPNPVALVASSISQLAFQANWNASNGATGYQIDVSTSSTFADFVPGLSNHNIGNVTSFLVNGLGAGATYYYQVRAVNSSGISGNSNVMGLQTLPLANQTITFDSLAKVTFGHAPIILSAFASSGLPIKYTSSDSSVAIIAGSTLTIVGAGTSTITASQSGNGNFKAAVPILKSLTVSKADQSITFNTLATKTFGDPSFNLSATSSSHLVVSFTSSDTTKAIILGNKVTLFNEGAVTIIASQSGNSNYTAASNVEQSFCINPAKPTINSGGTVLAPILTSTSVSGNQWFLNGTAIANATNATLTVNSSGSYTVQVTADNCQSVFSDPQVIVITGDVKISTQQGIDVFPNPARDGLMISLENLELGKSASIQIFDLLGRCISDLSGEGGSRVNLDIGVYSMGTYVVRVLQGDVYYHGKFVKQ